MELIRDFMCPDAWTQVGFTRERLPHVSPIPLRAGYWLDTLPQLRVKEGLRNLIQRKLIGTFSPRMEYSRHRVILDTETGTYESAEVMEI